MSLYALALELNLLLALVGATLVLLRSASVPGRRTYAALALAGAIWCGGELMVERGQVESVAGLRMAFLGLALVGPLWLGVAAHLSRLPAARRVPWFPVALAVPGLALWVLLFFQPWSALVMRPPREPGPLWWAYAWYSYGLIVAGVALHVAAGVRAPDPIRRWQRVAIGMAGLVPLATHATYAALGFPGARDPTPVALMPVGVALAAALFPGGLLELRPIALQRLVDQLPLGVVLANRRGAVIDVNPLAESALGIERGEALGRALAAIVAQAPSACRVELDEVRLAGQVIARFALLHPPADEGAADQERAA